MAFFQRSATILRSAVTCFRGCEQNGTLLHQKFSAHQSDYVLKSSSPFFGARFMCFVPSTKLFVGGLAWGMDENALREAFVEYGEVVEAKVVLDKESGRSKGFGFVSFTCTDHAEAAKQGLDGQLLSGRRLRVNFAIEKQRDFGSFGGYGGGGFGGGDSGSSYGNSSVSSGSINNDSFAPSGLTNEGSESFASNNTVNVDASGTETASGENDKFFNDDVFDDAFGKDENFAQGLK